MCWSSFTAILLRRDIYATPSARWSDPRSKLLTGPAWDAARGPTLNALGSSGFFSSDQPDRRRPGAVRQHRRRLQVPADGLLDEIDAAE